MDYVSDSTVVMVRKLDPRGQPVTSYTATVLERRPEGVVLGARWTRPALALGYTTFETGDQFTEWFYSDRWYNIFEIRGADVHLKGWYCNIAEPALISATGVSCRDLLLDLWVTPELTTLTLDEDEFAQDAHLTMKERQHALDALEQLRSMVDGGVSPFVVN